MILLISLFLIFIAFALISLSKKDIKILFSGTRTIQHGSLNRKYIVSSSAKPAKSIIVALHGLGGNSMQFAYFTALHNSVDDETIVIYPEALKPIKGSGLARGWNAGFCCGSGWKTNTDDVEFLATLIKKVSTDYNINTDKIFIVGFSNGAFMAQRLASERPDLVGALASISGTAGTKSYQIRPKQAVPILLMHGEQDKRVNFNGGASAIDPEFSWLSFRQTKEIWEKTNKLSKDDSAKVIVKTITYKDDGHKWHDWRLLNFWHKNTGASKEIVSFFQSTYKDIQ